MSDFSGKSVIVTGSSSGIGERAALMYASRGASVTVCGRDQARTQEVLEKCQKAGADAGHKNKFVAVVGEMTNAACRTETIKKTVEAFGKLDILVPNHAVTMHPPDVASVTEEQFDQIFDINLKSVLFLIQEALPHLEKTKGNIVVTSSMASYIPNNVGQIYFMSKAALDHMVRCLALEFGPKGIRINATNPTAVPTRLSRDRDMSTVPHAAELGKYIAQAHPLEGRLSEPDEQAEVILFLSSDAARFITGQCVKVDGGICLKGNPMSFFFQNLANKA